MLKAGQLYTFHVRGGPEGPSTYLGRFLSYDDDNHGRPTMFEIEQKDGTHTTLLADNILSIDHGDTWTYHSPGLEPPEEDWAPFGLRK